MARHTTQIPTTYQICNGWYSGINSLSIWLKHYSLWENKLCCMVRINALRYLQLQCRIVQCCIDNTWQSYAQVYVLFPQFSALHSIMYVCISTKLYFFYNCFLNIAEINKYLLCYSETVQLSKLTPLCDLLLLY